MIGSNERGFTAVEAVAAALPVLGVALAFTLLFVKPLSVEVRGPLFVATILSGFLICSVYARLAGSRRCAASAVGIAALLLGTIANQQIGASLVPFLGRTLPPPLVWPFVGPAIERAAVTGWLTAGLLIVPVALVAARAGLTVTALAILGGVSVFASVGWTEGRLGALGLLGALGPFLLVVAVALTPTRWQGLAAWCALSLSWLLVGINRWLLWGSERPMDWLAANPVSLAGVWSILPGTPLVFSVALLALTQMAIGRRRAREATGTRAG